MSSRFHLPNGAIAHYAWGSHIPRFSALAPVDTRTMPESLAGLAQDIAHWTNGADFRRKIAFQHEVVHYLQDMLTGVGYWDFLVRREHIPKLLNIARFSTSIHEVSSAIDIGDVYRPMKEELNRELIMVRADEQPAERRDALARAVATEAGDQYEPGGEVPYYIEHILEGEAVATVWMQFRNLAMSADQHEIAEAHSEFYSPEKMPPEYILTIQQFLTLAARIIGYEVNPDRPPTAEQTHTIFSFGYWLLIFLVDLSCAHPSPAMLEKLGAPKGEFEPGLKCIRLARAFQYIPEAENDTVLEAARNSDYDRIEEILLRHCSYPYPHSQVIYEDWKNVFDGITAGDDDRLVRLRRYCCERRLAVPADCPVKTIASFLVHKVPLYMLTHKGLQSFAFSWEYLDPQEQKVFVVDLARNERDWALVEFFLEGGRYVCPLAEGNICSGKTPACRTGITNTAQFPPADICHVRRGLEEADFRLELPVLTPEENS